VKEIDIIENVLPQLYWKEIQDLLTHRDFPWNYYDDISLITSDDIQFKENPEIVDSCGFSHTFVYKGRQSPYWQFIKPLMYSIAEKSKNRDMLQSLQPYRVKANLLTQLNSSTIDNCNMPHIDPAHSENRNTNWIFLYYVTDSDGDTFIFNEVTQNGLPPAKFTLNKRITPKANSCVIFRDNVYHASSNPIKSNKRINININLVGA
jgi:hypothetical protein